VRSYLLYTEIHLKHESDLYWKATLNALPVTSGIFWYMIIQIETHWSGIIQKLEELHPCGSLCLVSVM